ncbi:unnamed protein product [Hymenolepis diminuta]|uniref:Uncharacterized protein n=1 Tax=Hymenolepis diminuta TaxID=6216 RepID=A0A564ZA46_HYMDI|nr:unnamed protein product [Hymenolepis diminuta]
MPSSSILPRSQISEGAERLAELKNQNGDTVANVFNAKCSEVETEVKLRGRGCWRVVAFQNNLVFIGGWESECNHLPSRVDPMDPLTGRVLPLPDLIDARKRPVCVATENEIFVFTDFRLNAPAVYSREVYESASGSWSPLPLMIEKRKWYAIVNIPDSGILVMGGVGRKGVALHSTELLTCWSGDGGIGRGGGEARSVNCVPSLQ